MGAWQLSGVAQPMHLVQQLRDRPRSYLREIGLTSARGALKQRATARATVRASCSSSRDSRPASAPERPAGNQDEAAKGRNHRKTDVIRATANTARGRKASQDLQAEILAAVAALEHANPTPEPVSSPLLNGTWSLLYQGPEVVKEKGRGEALEGPVLAFLGLLFGWAFRTRGITQIIDAGEGSIQNLAEFKCLLFLRGSLDIVGTVTPSAAGADQQGESPTRVDVAFTYALLQLGWLKAKLPLSWANPTGWVETTYLDESLRIGHGDKGSVFVTTRRN